MHSSWVRPALGGAIVVSLVALTIVYRFNTMGGTLGGFENDEFLHVSRAQQMLRGDRLIRDFVEPGMPLTDALSAIAQAIVGPTLFAESALTIGMLALSTALLFLLALRASGSIVLATIVAVLQILMAPRFYNYPKLLVYALAIAAMWEYLERPRRSRLFLMAIVGVLAFLFRHDHGAYVGTAAIVTVAVAHWPQRDAIVRNVLVLGGMAFLLVAPYLLYAGMNGGVFGYFQADLAFAARDAGRTNLVLPAFAFDLSQPLVRREPARAQPPTVNVRWVDATDAARSAREHALGLVVYERLSRDVWKYSLTDVTPAALEAIVRDQGVADTEGIDRTTFTLNAPEVLRQPTRLERLGAAIGGLRILPGILRAANAIPFLYYLFVLIPVAALVTVFTMKGQAKIGVVAFLAILMTIGLLRGNLASRLADVSEVVGVLAAWLAALIVARRARPARKGAIVTALIILVLTASSINGLEGFSTGIPQTGIDNGIRGIGRRSREVYEQQIGRPPAAAWDRSVTGTVRLAQYVADCTEPSDRIFVFGYAPELYVFSDRGFAGGLPSVLPGFYVSDAAQRQIIARLASTRVPIVVTALEREYDDDYKPDFPLVDAFLHEHYVDAGVADLGNGVRYRILADRTMTPARMYEPLRLPCFR